MPALPSPGKVIKATINWGIEADVLAQTIHYFGYSSAAPSAADLSNLATNIVLDGMDFQALASDTVGMIGCTCRDLSSDMGNEATAGAPWVGTRGTALTPPGAAVVVSHSIGRHYRGGHARTYLPLGVAGDITTGGIWSTAFVDDVDAAWGTFVSNILTGGPYGSIALTNLVQVSFFGPPNRIITSSTGRVRTVSTVRVTPIVDTVTGHVTRRNIGSQRRRNRDA